MDEEIDRQLQELGARWRADQPRPPEVDLPTLVSLRRAPNVGTVAAVATIVVVAVLAGSVVLRPAILSDGGAQNSETPRMADCPVTKPDEPFNPPSPFPSNPTSGNQKVWYGAESLWTMLNRDGETWGRLLNPPRTITVKSFWFSTLWSPETEPQPDISVMGQQLDGSGVFTAGSPGTNAGADFGMAMLVGFDVPAPGCWRITATYREATLSYVVRAIDD